MTKFKLTFFIMVCLFTGALLIWSSIFVVAVISEDFPSFSDREISYEHEILEGVNSSKEIVESVYSEQLKNHEYEGYIVQLEKNPIVVESYNLNKTAQENQNSALNKIPLIKSIYGAFVVMPEDVSGKVEKHKQDIQEEREQVKQKIFANFQRIGITGNVISEQGNLEVGQEFDLVFNGFYLNISDEEAKKIERIDGVKSVSPNYKVQATLMDSVPLIQDGILAGKLDEDGNDCTISLKPCLTGEGITIAIIDTGVDYTHPDLGGCLGPACKVIGGYDFVNGDNNPIDDMGHGTHCAGIAAGNGNGRLKGVAPNAKILSYKVLDAGGSGSWGQVISGIEQAIIDGADILSLSLGGGGNPDDIVSQAVDNAVLAGKVVVVAAGNEGPNEQTVGSPGTARNAITVGATNKNNALSGFSSRGPVIWTDSEGNEKAIIKPDVLVPGVNICAAQWDDAFLDQGAQQCLDNDHIAISGTSMATPHVAGVVALLKQKHSDWTPGEIKNSIKGTAVNLGLSINEQGAGRVNVGGVISLQSPLEPSWDFYVYTKIKVNSVYDPLELKGIFPRNYDSLDVQWKKEGENNWRVEGMRVVGKDGIVAEFDPMGMVIETGNYSFRIMIRKEGIEKEGFVSVWFDKDLSKIIIPSEYLAFAFNQFNFYDINQDGNKEIIIGSYGNPGKVFAFTEKGSQIEGWPLVTDSSVEMAPAISDIDNDGKIDIIVPNTDIVNAPKLYRFNGNGGKIWEKAFEGSSAISCVTIDNFKGTNEKNILIYTQTTSEQRGFIRMLNKDGEELWNRSVEGNIFRNHGTYGDCALSVDLLHNGTKEVVVQLFLDGAQKIIVLSSEGDLIYSKMFDTPFPPTNLVGYNASVFFGKVYPLENNNYDNKYFMLANHDGKFSTALLYEDNNSAGPLDSILLSDMNNDQVPEILSTGFSKGNHYSGCLYNDVILNVINLNGILLDSKSFSGACGPSGMSVSSDITGDKIPEIILSFSTGDIRDRQGGVSLVDGKNLNIIRSYKKFSIFNFANGIISFDNNNLSLVSQADDNIFIYDLNSFYDPSIMDWPMFQHDPQHTGCYYCDPRGSRPTCTNFTYSEWGQCKNGIQTREISSSIPEGCIGGDFVLNRTCSAGNLSRIVNNGNLPVSGTLMLYIQRRGKDGWDSYLNVLKEERTLAAAGSLNLVELWNNRNITIKSSGEYRLVTEFKGESSYYEIFVY